MVENEYEEDTIDLMEIIRFLMNKLWIIILCMCIGAGVAGTYTGFMVEPMYSASSTLYILGSNPEVVTVSDLQLGDQLAKDFQELVRKRIVVEQVIDDLQLDMTYDQAVKMIHTSNPEDTRFLQIQVESEDPVMAARISNELALVTSKKAVSVMGTDKPSIVENAIVPTDPSSPSMKKNIVLGALLGAVLAAAALVAAYMMDDTIKSPEDVKKYLDLNTLASFPDEKGRKK